MKNKLYNNDQFLNNIHLLIAERFIFKIMWVKLCAFFLFFDRFNLVILNNTVYNSLVIVQN